MGTFISKHGELTIPEDKWNDFLREAKIVADQGGLFEISRSIIKRRALPLMRFPSFVDTEGSICFDCCYFEESIHECAGIKLKNRDLFCGKIGDSEYNLSVQALFYLAETYSSTPFFTHNDSLCVPLKTIKWLRYVLNRDVAYGWSSSLQDVSERSEKTAKETMSSTDIITTENFFCISSDDRLPWWREGGDVIITPNMEALFNDFAARFKSITMDDLSGSSDEWQMNLINMFGENLDHKSGFSSFNPPALLFEDLFYELFTNLHQIPYRAVVKLMEKYLDSSSKLKCLIAVFENKSLRKKILDF